MADPEADRKLVAAEVARCRANAAKGGPEALYWTGRGDVLEDAPTAMAAEVLRDDALRALGGQRDPERWQKWVMLSFQAH